MHETMMESHRLNIRVTVLLLLAVLTFTGCQPDPLPGPTLPETATQIPLAPSPSITSTTTLTPTPTPLPWAGFSVSSPLADISLTDLRSILSEPFLMPAPGEDGGHHGADFAYYSRGTHETMVGLPIYSMLSGIVAAVTDKKNPYGNLVIVESKLMSIPPGFLASVPVPTHLSPYPYDPRLIYCSSLLNQQWQADPVSIYILYGHLVEPTSLNVGDVVVSGQQIGGVGNTGMSGNPHLHLEMRIGPGDSKFSPMGYYDTSATPDEMLAYCDWRVSGRYVLLDPMVWIEAWLAFSTSGGG